MFREQGLAVQPEDFIPFVGAGEIRYIGGVAEKYGFPLDISAAKARTYQIYLDLVPQCLRAFPGARELVVACRGAGLKTAVASSADPVKIEANLRRIDLAPETWDAVVTAFDVERRKPFPDIFLAAARMLGHAADECVVVEDAVNGIEAAQAAGMRCIAVAQTFAAGKLSGADLARNTIADITLSDLESR
jgi:HAD superfamily hydrolase (TIGR01509 family)